MRRKHGSCGALLLLIGCAGQSKSGFAVENSEATASPVGIDSATHGPRHDSKSPPSSCQLPEPDDMHGRAQLLLESWQRGARDCALKVANDEVVTKLFADDGSSRHWAYDDCLEQDLPEPHFDCVYHRGMKAVHFRVHHSPIDGWRIYDVVFLAKEQEHAALRPSCGCGADHECIKLVPGCCGCGMGGQELAVAQRCAPGTAKCDRPVPCPAVYRCTNRRAACIDGQCQLVH